jgi:uncharacterized protein
MAKQLIVTCPQCSKEVVWNKESPYRPFCSERCKLIDLGQWANEGYRIPENEQHPDQAENGN